MSLSPSTIVLLQLLPLETTVHPPVQDFSELFPRKQHVTPQVKARQGPLFTNGDHVIWNLEQCQHAI